MQSATHYVMIDFITALSGLLIAIGSVLNALKKKTRTSEKRC